MTAIPLLIAIPILMWVTQSLTLQRCGLPIRWRLSNKDAPRQVRTVGRIVTQISLVSVIIAYPLLIGSPVWKHYESQFPPDATRWQAVQGAAMAILVLAGLLLVWLACERIEIQVRHHAKRWGRRLLLLIPSAIFGAVVEECVFRGIVQFDLARSGLASVPSVLLSGTIFAAAHYVRSAKRKWTVFGHLALGIALATAYAVTHNLWLATGIHAGGIFVILGARPFIRYRGPAWLTGESIFPFAGIPGIVGLVVLTLIILERFAIP